jgi:hypothetical protein
MAKIFSHINTIVNINDKQKLTFVELEVRYPGENEVVRDLLQKHYACKATLDNEDRSVWKMNLRTDDKKTLQTILKALDDFDKQYASRTEIVNDLMDLLK